MGVSRVSTGLVSGRYRLLNVIGAGGMGRVWLADDELLDRRVAIKEINTPVDAGNTQMLDVQLRTVREARAAAKLGHPAVVTVFDVVWRPGQAWIVMEYVQSRSLHDAIKQDGPMPHDEVARIGLQVLGGLRAAHAVGVLHRDVKPHNVLLADDGRVVLTDFGLATFEGAEKTSDLLMGSPHYVAPERLTADIDQGEAADLWSLGATLYTAVEGHPPFARATTQASLGAVLHEPPDEPQHPGLLTPVIMALLTKDPKGRPAAPRVEEALSRIVTPIPRTPGAGSGVEPATRPQPVPRVDPTRPISPAPISPAPISPAPVAYVSGTAPAARPVSGPPAGPGSGHPGNGHPGSGHPVSGVPGRGIPRSRPGSGVPVGGATAGGATAGGATAGGRPGGGRPGSGVPVSGAPISGGPGSGTPISGAPISGIPTSGAARGSAAVRPATEAGRRPRARRGVMVAVVAAVAALAAGIGTTVALAGTGNDDKGAKSTTSTSASRTGTGVPPGFDPCGFPAAGATPVGATNATSPILLAPGWVWHRDNAGFALPLPDGWSRAVDGGATCFRNAKGTGAFRVDSGAPVTADPSTYWKTTETTEKTKPGYRYVGMATLPLRNGAADYEYTWLEGKVREHTRRVLVETGPGLAFLLQWTTTDQDWAANLTLQQRIVTGFQQSS
jgi:eukaryotic-like serine/threonine-protein kinase